MVDQCGSGSPFPLVRFQKCLAAVGKRLSEPRRLVAEKVFSWTGTFTADEVVRILAAEVASPAVTRPAVYRTLAELVEFGLLQRIPPAGSGTFMVLDG